MTLRSELFPAPLGPMTEQISPLATSKLTSESAVTPWNEREICSRLKVGSVMTTSSGRKDTARVTRRGERVPDREPTARLAYRSTPPLPGSAGIHLVSG